MNITDFKKAMRLEFFRLDSDTTLSDSLLSTYYDESVDNIFNELMTVEDKTQLPFYNSYTYTIVTPGNSFALETTKNIIEINSIMINTTALNDIIVLNKAPLSEIMMNYNELLAYFNMINTKTIRLNTSTSGIISYEAIVVEDAKALIESLGNYDSVILENGKVLCKNYLGLY